MINTETLKGPFKIQFQETLNTKIVDNEIQLSDDDGNVKVRITHENDGDVTVNGEKYFFKDGKIRLKAFW